MEIILKKNVIGLGEEGDIVNVKPGYARNYLVPKNLCDLKTPNNLRILEKHKQEIEKRKAVIAQENNELKEKIEASELIIERKVVEGNKLYGSVSSKDIVSLLLEKSIEVNKQNIEMPGHIKIIGKYIIPIRLESGAKAELKIEIVPLSE
jgi:large subunit ribosomal protein L9